MASGIALVGEVSDRTRARVMATGELMATSSARAFLRAQGENVAWADARTLLKCRGAPRRFGEGERAVGHVRVRAG